MKDKVESTNSNKSNNIGTKFKKRRFYQVREQMDDWSLAGRKPDKLGKDLKKIQKRAQNKKRQWKLLKKTFKTVESQSLEHTRGVASIILSELENQNIDNELDLKPKFDFSIYTRY